MFAFSFEYIIKYVFIMIGKILFIYCFFLIIVEMNKQNFRSQTNELKSKI